MCDSAGMQMFLNVYYVFRRIARVVSFDNFNSLFSIRIGCVVVNLLSQKEGIRGIGFFSEDLTQF